MINPLSLLKLTIPGLPDLPYKFIAVVALVVGAYFYGVHMESARAQVEIDNYITQQKDLIEKVNTKQVQIVDRAVTQYVDRIVKIKDTGENNANKINQVPDRNVILSSGWVYYHDSSASGNDAESARITDATPSGISADFALGIVASNYTSCLENKEQLEDLQKWVRDTALSINTGK